MIALDDYESRWLYLKHAVKFEYLTVQATHKFSTIFCTADDRKLIVIDTYRMNNITNNNKWTDNVYINDYCSLRQS